MLYADYRRKVLKFADFLKILKRFRVLILSVLAAIVCVTAGLLGVSGMVYDVTDCPAEVTYGEELGYKAAAVLGSVRYEYSADGSDVWTDEVPTDAGDYLVRAVSRTAFGGNRYGNTYGFSILPKETEVTVAQSSVTYGELPSVTADLSYSDTIECTNFIYGDIGQSSTTVTPDLSAVTIYSSSGKDVTSNYILTTSTSDITFTQRSVTIVVEDVVQEYNGEELTSSLYEVSSSTPLAEGDYVLAVFSASITEVGSVTNTPQIRIFHNSDGNIIEVTGNYNINIVPGTLTVTQRALYISTESYEWVYDGQTHSAEDYQLTGGTLIEGHSLAVSGYTYITDAGSAENIACFTVVDKYGNDVTEYYSINLTAGTLTVTARPITITADSAEKVYDGTALTGEGYSTENLVSEHSLTAETSGSQTDAGASSNVIVEGSVVILDEEGNDVTANYDISYAEGTLEVTARSITITADSAEKMYDGTALTCETYSAGNLVSGHTLTAETSGSQTDIGSSSNVIVEGSVVILDEEGNDVTSNYDISYAEGTLTVTARQVTITAGSATKQYDGTALICETYRPGNLVSGHTLTAETSGSQTDIGTSSNVIVEGSVKITDEEGNDVTASYKISYAEGTLTVTARPITITAGSATKKYDGTELTCDEYEITSGSLLEDNVLTVKIAGSQTDVGKSDNKASDAAIKDKSGKDVTSNYSITYVSGTLKVLIPGTLTISTGSDSKVYDGTALTCDTYNYTSTLGLDGRYSELPEYIITITVTGAITNVGSVENSVEFTVTDSAGNDWTEYADYTISCGTLTVVPRPITVYTGSGEWVYDGGTHSCEEYWVTDGVYNGEYDGKYDGVYELVSGHSVSASNFATITNAGTINNTADITITDSAGTNVTSNYVITYNYGTLTVTKRPIYVMTGSNEWEYDGEVHSYEVSEVKAGKHNGFTYELIEGHTITVDDFATIKDVGSIENSANITITDGEGNDVTANYDISVDYGTLTVTGDEDLQETAASDLDTSGKIAGGGSGAAGNAVTFRVYSTESATLYFKLKSFGNYTGNSWEDAKAYDELIDGTYSLSYLTSLVLESEGYTLTEVQVEALTNDYLLPYFLSMAGGDYDIQTSDVYFEGDIDGIYTVMICIYDYLTDGALSAVLGDEYAEVEQAYCEYVYENYLDVPESTLEYLQTIIDEQGFSAEDEDIIAKVATYIQNAATYNLEYDTALDSEEDIVVAFLSTYKEGICQHYASAATLLFRALGIPARYTIGYVAYTSAGEWVNVTPETAHAWVEVYINGLGWVNVEVTGGGPGGGLVDGSGDGSGSSGGSGSEDQTIEITIKPQDELKVYDGTALTSSAIEGANDESSKLLAWLKEQGYTWEVEFSGSITASGTATSSITKFILYDSDGNDVTDRFTINFAEGNLTVVGAVIVIHPYELSKTYDGTALSYEKDDYYVTGLPDGWTVEFSLEGISLTDVGVITANRLAAMIKERGIGIKVYDKDGNLLSEETFDYVILFEGDIALAVYPRSITITANSAEKVYDGDELTADGYYISTGSLIEGHCIEVTINSSITDIGTTANVISSVRIYYTDADGNEVDVTSYYCITCKEGTLTVV